MYRPVLALLAVSGSTLGLEIRCPNHPVWPGGTQNVMVAVAPIVSEPASSTVQLSVRLMIHVASLVRSAICVVLDPITVPVSVLFPDGGRA